MRFKAKLQSKQIALLHDIISPISKLSQRSVLYLDPSVIQLTLRSEEGICAFVELKSKHGIFFEQVIESVNKNRIVFEIDLQQFRTALQSILGDDRNRKSDANEEMMGIDSGVTVMKLAKRYGGMPCLCIDAACAGGSVEVHHAIPVRIMQADDIQYHRPPEINLPTVQLEMTNQKPLRVVVERLKSISPHVFIEGSMAGELVLRVDSDGSSIRTFFNKLIPRFEDCDRGGSQLTGTDLPTCTLKVDTKKLSSCLQWQATAPKTVSTSLLCMVDKEMLVLHVLLNPSEVGFFTYYIPVHFISDEDGDF